MVEVKQEAGEAAQPSPAPLDSGASGTQDGATTPAMPQAAVPKPGALVKKVGVGQVGVSLRTTAM
ncbi:hypothetical protein HaLaN_19650, partial [Haematococcus lacustris]